MAHLGSEKVLELARRRFYWPRMQNHIDHYIRKQCRCIIAKRPNIPQRAPLIPIMSTYPFEIVSLDYLKLDKAKGGFEYALVVCDHFTRFIQIYATKNKSAIAAADKIYNQFILNYGFPMRLHHDQGKEFENSLFKRLNQLSGISSSRTTPYHPMGDGQTERMNRTIINMLKTLGEKEKENWKDLLPKLAYAYNSTVNKSTGYSPYYLMFGRSPRLPIDLMFGVEPDERYDKQQIPYKKYVEKWEHGMKQAINIAKEHAKKSGERNKVYYDRKMHGVELVVGDKVLLRDHKGKGGTGKLTSYWEDMVYVVTECNPELPVYSIKPTEGNGKVKRVHRNNLMKCNFILSKHDPTTEKKKATRPQLKKKMLKGLHSRRLSTAVMPEELSDTDSDESVIIVRSSNVNLRGVVVDSDKEEAYAEHMNNVEEHVDEEDDYVEDRIYSSVNSELINDENYEESTSDSSEGLAVVDADSNANGLDGAWDLTEELDDFTLAASGTSAGDVSDHENDSAEECEELPIDQDEHKEPEEVVIDHEAVIDGESSRGASTTELEDESDDEGSDVSYVRRSDRQKKRTRVFTYDKIGGKPRIRTRSFHW